MCPISQHNPKNMISTLLTIKCTVAVFSVKNVYILFLYGFIYIHNILLFGYVRWKTIGDYKTTYYTTYKILYFPKSISLVYQEHQSSKPEKAML